MTEQGQPFQPEAGKKRAETLAAPDLSAWPRNGI